MRWRDSKLKSLSERGYQSWGANVSVLLPGVQRKVDCALGTRTSHLQRANPVSKHLHRCERMTPQNASGIAIGHPCKLQLLLVQTETVTIPVSKVFACAKQTWKPNTFIVVSNCPNLTFQHLHLLNLFFWQVYKCMVYAYIYRHVHMCGDICVCRHVCMWVGMHVKARDLLSSSSSSFHLTY